MNVTTETTTVTFSELKKDIVDYITATFDQYEHNPEMLQKIVTLFKERVPMMIEKQKKSYEDKVILEIDLKNVSLELMNKYCKHKYIYNYDTQSFYEISDKNDRLVIINSDLIYLNIKQYIPVSLCPHKYIIFKMLKKNLKENHLLTWEPSLEALEHITELTNQLFDDLETTRYFMFVVGSILMGNEKCLFNSDKIHLWYGYGSQQLIKFVEELLYQKSFSYNLRCNHNVVNNIKTSFNGKYPLEKVWYMYIPEINKKKILKMIHTEQELFFVSCYKMAMEYDLTYWEKSDFIGKLQSYKELFNLFYSYFVLNVSTEDMKSLLLFDEIKDDFKEYLKELKYPDNMLKLDDIKICISKLFDNETFGIYTMYKGKLTVNTSYSLFLKFCEESIQQKDQLATPPSSFPDTHLLSDGFLEIANVGDIYENYKRWHLKYNKDDQLLTHRLFDFYMKYVYPDGKTKDGWMLQMKTIVNDEYPEEKESEDEHSLTSHNDIENDEFDDQLLYTT